MTRTEALAFLERNPKSARIVEAIMPVRDMFEHYYHFGAASNEQDALQDLIEVIEALERKD